MASTYHKLDEGHKYYQVINDIEDQYGEEIDESIFDLDPRVAQFSDGPIEELREHEINEIGLDQQQL